MNLALLDPFQNNFPEKLADHCLEAGRATTCAFNRRGTMLATGCIDGSVVLWDWETEGVIKTLRGSHTKALTSVTWSRNGRRLATASQDGKVVVWSVETSSPICQFQVATEPGRWCERVEIHPVNTDLVVATIRNAVPALCNASDGSIRPVIERRQEEDETKAASSSKQGAQVVAAFSRDGTYMYVGQPKGLISIINTTTLAVYGNINVGSNNIKQIVLSPINKSECETMLVNSSDKALRLIKVNLAAISFECVHTFRDVVNNRQILSSCFNGTGEFVAGAASDKSDNIIFVWNVDSKELAKTLDGVNEGMADFAWNPRAPIIVSITQGKGSLLVWEKMYAENWSAFAPNFKELEENEEYVEREDEFDVIPEEELERKKQQAEDDIVDIMTIPPTARIDVDPDELVYLPAVPDLLYAHPPPPAAAAGGAGGSNADVDEAAEAPNEEIRVVHYPKEDSGKRTSREEEEDGEASEAKKAKNNSSSD